MAKLPYAVRWIGLDKPCEERFATKDKRDERVTFLRCVLSPGPVATLVTEDPEPPTLYTQNQCDLF